MKGHPKFYPGQEVTFDWGNEKKKGEIYIVDKFGCIDYPDDVSYDILSKEDNCLYKHIQEKEVYENAPVAR